MRAAATQGRRGGRSVADTADQLDVARARLACGESVTAIAAHLGVGPAVPGQPTAATSEPSDSRSGR